MAKPGLGLIISLAIITIFIFSHHLINAQSESVLKHHPEANLSTTWINNPTIYIFSMDHSPGFQMTPVLSLSNTSQFLSGFYCFSNGTSSCFFGIIVFGRRYDYENYTRVTDPQLVWSANRDRPVGINARLKLTGNGDLILEDADGDMVWSTNTGGKSVTGIRFTVFGNLVLFDRNNEPVWQSFDHPTDSLLSGQKLVEGQKLRARTSASDFSQGLFWLSVGKTGRLSGYFEAEKNPQLHYYDTDLAVDSYYSSKYLKGWYVSFENESFNGQNIPLGSTAQFMRLEPDGHLKVYEWGGDGWKTVADLLTPRIGECGYPLVCGKYGICSSNGQCGCFEVSNNEITRNFKQRDYTQPNLGCSLVAPITCNDPRYHSLLELNDTSYIGLYSLHDTGLNKKIQLEDCKNACLKNCSCKAALFLYDEFDYSSNTLTRGCLLLSDVFSLRNNNGGNNNDSVFLKLQNSPTKQPSIRFPKKKSRRGPIVLGSSLGAVFGVCLLVGSCIFVYKNKREQEELDDEYSFDKMPGMPTRFSYGDLKTATNDFNNKLGQGGFGSVFQGMLSDGTEVAVKRLDGLSQIKKKSFLAEVETIGNIHHVNLVRLTGFCSEKSHRLLVYEYMPKGSLDRWIFRRKEHNTLGWNFRKKIILDVAKGLAYLHEDCRQKIYHLDIKPQNILLDDNFNAKISDFGLSKLIDKDRSQVVTTMRGTPGYLAPEWLTSFITEKVDVYSFGVMLLEILCGRKNIDRSKPEEDMHLLSLFKRKAEEGMLLDLVVNHNDEMQLHVAEVVEMMRLALWCLQGDFTKRPLMSTVVKVLEGSVDVENNLEYSFTTPTVPTRTIAAAAGHVEGVISSGTRPLPSTLSGPR